MFYTLCWLNHHSWIILFTFIYLILHHREVIKTAPQISQCFRRLIYSNELQVITTKYFVNAIRVRRFVSINLILNDIAIVFVLVYQFSYELHWHNLVKFIRCISWTYDGANLETANAIDTRRSPSGNRFDKKTVFLAIGSLYYFWSSVWGGKSLDLGVFANGAY